MVEQPGERHRRGQRGLLFDLHHRQLPTHSWKRPDFARTPGGGAEGRGLQIPASHESRRAHGVQPTGGVEQLFHSDMEPLLDPTDGPGQGAFEIDLCRSETACPELVLQPPDAKAIGSGGVETPGHQKAPQTEGALVGTVGAGGHGEEVGIGHRAEPLLAGDPPGAGLGRVGHGMATLAPTSEPPCTSVRNCDPRRHRL